MRPKHSTKRWFAAAVCVLATAGFAAAEEGVVRISDANTRPGVVRMNAGQRPLIQQTAYGTAGHSGAAFANHAAFNPQRYQSSFGTLPRPTGRKPYQNVSVSPAGHTQPGGEIGYQPLTLMSNQCGHCGCGADGCGSGSCGCGVEGCCNGNGNAGRCRNGKCNNGYFPSGRDARKMRRNGELCEDDYCLGDGYQQRMWTLFARATPKDGCTRWPTRWWRGQQGNFLTRNQRLSNTLFGWLVPSGCCGQGCPPVGCYNVTYADDPGYSDGRDGGMAYGVQGYGVPVTVPLAPNVRQSYNYSWGTPASRITQLGQYSPGTAQQSPYQSW